MNGMNDINLTVVQINGAPALCLIQGSVAMYVPANEQGAKLGQGIVGIIGELAEQQKNQKPSIVKPAPNFDPKKQ